MSRSKLHAHRAAIAVLLLGAFASAGCRKDAPSGGRGPSSAAARVDALFLAEAPVVVPEEIAPELDEMGVRRLYVAAASLSAGGQVRSFPPPPARVPRPVLLVLMGEPGVEGGLRGNAPEALGEAWASGTTRLVAEAKGWAEVIGVHVHLVPTAGDAAALAAALGALKSRLPGLTLSVTLRAGAPEGTWKPLAGSVDEALVLTYGRRPETADAFVSEMTEEEAKAFPIPFRLLAIPGSYGVAGSGARARRLPDGEMDKLSEDRNLDFDFASVLSSDPGNIYSFKPRLGYEKATNLLSEDGGRARFDVLPFADLVRLVSATSRWSVPRLSGRVFLVDGVPRDGRLSGYPAVRALLTGKPWEPSLRVEAIEEKTRGGEVWLRVSNPGPTPSELSRFGNQITIRLEGGVFTGLGAGDFDRYEIFASARDLTQSAPFGRATACRLFENFFAPEESNELGPIRIAGKSPRMFVTYQLTLPDGRTIDGAEAEVAIPAPPSPKAAPRTPAKRQPPLPRLKKR
ncbi:MAG TPA: hypothetical protein PLP50_04055 [Thermoanaerobaculia bacterium]|jgi:hypothetical protein|nr:hypothetical protein [Thermoanaerobaculia bacterium]HPA50754.1 hypothetical protein [Thermoanaerobaculia bacterium]HQN07442.1 hypothetical protein [Thermoanaerobaculia bacterium]HQP86055.1 hypothetical protein [Thermoanaerobaculia bacterium]